MQYEKNAKYKPINTIERYDVQVFKMWSKADKQPA